MTTSPTETSSGTRLPLSSTRPGPTAMTVPSWGFSLAVSGMTRPEAAVARAAALQAEGTDLLAGLSRLRAEAGPELAGPAWELARLRARARPVFGADADVLFLTADTLEQAGRPALATRRAPRLLADHADSAADLGCASGTDTVALARAGASVLAVDLDP